MGGTMQREYPRKACSINLHIQVLEAGREEPPPVAQTLQGTMADFGFGGFRIRTNYPLRVGQNIRTRVVGGDYPTVKSFPPESTAEVVWVAPAGGSIVAGLKFLS